MTLLKVFLVYVMTICILGSIFALVQSAIHFEATKEELWPAIICGWFIFPFFFSVSFIAYKEITCKP